MCKAVSINYALVEVLFLVRDKVGVLCTIETRDGGGGASVSYSLQVSPSQTLRLRMSWRKKHNIVYRNPRTAETTVKGTLASLETEFRLPPEPGVPQAYRLHLKYKRSMKAKIVSKVSCTDNQVAPTETLMMTAPLRTEEQSQAAPPAKSDNSDYSGKSLPLPMGERSPSSSTPALKESLMSFKAQSVKLAPNTSPENREDSFVGILRVSILRAWNLTAPQHRIPGTLLGVAEPDCSLYCRCVIGAHTTRTKSIRGSLSPSWQEVWELPVTAGDLRDEVLLEILDEGSGEQLGRARVPVVLVLGHSGKVSVSEELDGLRRGAIALELEFIPDHDKSAEHVSDDAGGCELSSGKEQGEAARPLLSLLGPTTL